MTPITTLSGVLVRRGPNDWAWRDGALALEVRDLAYPWNFRCRTYSRDASGEYRVCVEVLAGVAREDDALAWVLRGKYPTGDSGDHTGPLDLATGERLHIAPGDDPLRGDPRDAIIRPGPIPRVVLVPSEEWDAHWAASPYGAEWDLAHEPAILQRAWDLGWVPPPGWVSRTGWTAPA